MRFKLFAFIWFAALAALPITLSADEPCCDKPDTACCEKAAMPCCDKPEANPPAPAAGCCDKAANHNHGAQGCCQDGKTCDMPCCADGKGCDMPCCNKDVEITTIDILFAMDSQARTPANAAPARQTAVVLFQRPVWVGPVVLMGKHYIEHDTDRMARGEPCTHIYAADDLKTPVAKFHCTHLEGVPTDTAVVMLRSQSDGSQRLLQFQFKGESAAHGYPTGR